jgi:hypothetical protein
MENEIVRRFVMWEIFNEKVSFTDYVTLLRQAYNWKMWCKIPINPNIREVDGFEFSKDLDLMVYSVELYKNLLSLDQEVANMIEELYNQGEFPKRINNLFYIGQRQRR